MQRFNGLSFDFDFGDFAIHAKKFSLDIEDGTEATSRDGRPDGWVQGAVSASGSITVDRAGLGAMVAAAKSAGSFQALPVFDINAFAKVAGGEDDLQVEAFGCKVKLSKLLDVDKSSSDETEFELPYLVTSPDFVKIDGVPYFDEDEE